MRRLSFIFLISFIHAHPSFAQEFTEPVSEEAIYDDQMLPEGYEAPTPEVTERQEEVAPTDTTLNEWSSTTDEIPVENIDYEGY